MKSAYLLLSTGLLLIACERKPGNQPAPRPVAVFDAPATAETYATLQMQNRSTNANSYLWNWGDGTTDTNTSPSHSYATLGAYRVQLQATGPGGTDTLSKVIQVNRLAPPNIGRIAGNYYGRWIETRSGYSIPGGGTVITTGYSTRQIKVLSSTMVQVDTYPVTYSASSAPWAGNAPQRGHTDFIANTPGWPAFTSDMLQVEQTGDSIYFQHTSTQLALYAQYQFYGKKTP